MNAKNQGIGFIPFIDQLKLMMAKANAQAPVAMAQDLGVMKPEEKIDVLNMFKVPKPEMIPGESGQIAGMGPLMGRK